MQFAPRLQTSEILQGPDAGQEKVRAALYDDEAAQVVHAVAQGLSLHSENSITFLEIAHQRIDLAIQAGKYGVVDPSLLHKFEFAIETDKVQTPVGAVVDHGILEMTSIGTSPAQNAVAVCRVQSRRRIWAQCIARIGAANVRSDRASKAVGIFIEVGEIVFIAKGRIIGFWRQDQWGAAFPPADKLRSQTIAGVGITGTIGAGGCLVEKIPKLSDALGQLTEHEIRPVAAEIVHPGFGVQAGSFNPHNNISGLVLNGIVLKNSAYD